MSADTAGRDVVLYGTDTCTDLEVPRAGWSERRIVALMLAIMFGPGLLAVLIAVTWP